MKNTFKRIFALLLALVMVLSLTACGGGAEKPAADSKQPAAEGNKPAAEGKEEAGKITILYPGEETPRFKEFLENEFAAKVKEDIGLEIEMIWLPWDQYWTQKEIMLSAQDEIDLYWDGLADLSTFVNKHQARPLDDLIQTYGQDMLKVIPMSWLEGGKMNGEIFGIPSAYGPSSAQFQLVCVRQDLLEGVGMTEIKTAEDLVAFARIETLEGENRQLRQRLREIKKGEKEAYVKREKEFHKTLTAYFGNFVPLLPDNPPLDQGLYRDYLANTPSCEQARYPESEDAFVFFPERVMLGREKRFPLFITGQDRYRRKTLLRFYPKKYYVGLSFTDEEYGVQASSWLVRCERANDGAMNLVFALPLDIVHKDYQNVRSTFVDPFEEFMTKLDEEVPEDSIVEQDDEPDDRTVDGLLAWAKGSKKTVSKNNSLKRKNICI